MSETKKLTEIFKTLEEYKEGMSKFKYYLNDEDWEFFSWAFGIGDNMAESEIIIIDGKEIKLDKSMAPFIKELNDNSIPTLACCSGFQYEHFEKYKPVSGYMAIKFNNEIYEYLQKHLIDEIITIEESDCYYEHCISIHIHTKDDDIMLSKWNLIKNIFRRYITEKCD